MSVVSRHIASTAARLSGCCQPSNIGRCLPTSTTSLSARLSASVTRSRRFASTTSSSKSSSSASASPAPLTVYSMQLPQLSPSMSGGAITAVHVQPGSTVSPASLVFTLTTHSLLEQPSSPPHTMLVESHDGGVVGWVDDGVVGSGEELRVGRLVGWMWEDEADEQRGQERRDEITRAVQQAAQSTTASTESGGVREVNGIWVRPFLWQAYLEKRKMQDDELPEASEKKQAGG